MKYEWYIKEIAALFIILTIIIAILGKISLDDTVESFTQGSASLIGGSFNHWCITRYFSRIESRAYYRPTTVSSVGRNETCISFFKCCWNVQLPSSDSFYFSIR
ncbi:hypothetical protein ACT7DM_08840 [Bacillus cereus]